MSEFKKLNESFERCMTEMAEIGDQIEWVEPQAYGTWLAQTYYYVCHSTRLLALAASRFKQEDGAFHSRFLDHLREEKGHENLALLDLKKMSLNIADFPPIHELNAFYQTQYYWIEHISPISFLGYILCLEGYAVRRGGHFHTRITSALGADKAAFLRVHRDEDTEHLKKAFEQLSGLPEEELKNIRMNMEASCHFYGLVLKQVRAVELSRRGRAAS